MAALIADAGYLEDQTLVDQRQAKAVGPARRSLGCEMIVLEQVEDGDLPLLFLVARGGGEGFVVEFDRRQTVGEIAHRSLFSRKVRFRRNPFAEWPGSGRGPAGLR